MAEAPPPPSGLDYNSFRTWRKNNGLTNTQPALSDAWKEYKDSSVGKKSPVRSPKKSPGGRYGGLSRATLTGLPQEVTAMITSGVGRKGIHALTVASKQTGRIVANRRAELCDEPLTQLEILNGLDRIPLPASIEIVSRDRNNVLMERNYLLFDREGDKVVVKWRPMGRLTDTLPVSANPIKRYLVGIMEPEKKRSRLRTYTIGLSPVTWRSFHRLRLSCLTEEYNAKNGVVAKAALLKAVQNMLANNNAVNRVLLQRIITGEEEIVQWPQFIDRTMEYTLESLTGRIAWFTADAELQDVVDSLEVSMRKAKSKKMVLIRMMEQATWSLRNAYASL